MHVMMLQCQSRALQGKFGVCYVKSIIIDAQQKIDFARQRFNAYRPTKVDDYHYDLE